MTAQPAEQPDEIREGDTLTVTGRVVRVRGAGRMALVEVPGGRFYVPLPGPNALPDGHVVVTHAPALARVVEVRPGGCASCGR